MLKVLICYVWVVLLGCLYVSSRDNLLNFLMVDFRIEYIFVLFLILVFMGDVLLLIFFDYGLILY